MKNIILFTIILFALNSFAQRTPQISVRDFSSVLNSEYKQGWKLVFKDDFNSFDNTKWDIDEDNLYGAEKISIIRGSNVKAENGNLKLKAKKEDILYDNIGYKYSSGEVLTKSNTPFQYGYYEIRCRVPRGNGFHSAFWLYGCEHDINAQTYGQSHEIDVFEMSGTMNIKNTHKKDLATNYRKFEENNNYNETFHIYTADSYYSSMWHTYAIEWTPEEIIWFLDNKPVRTVKSNPSSPFDIAKMIPLRIWLTLGIGPYEIPDSQTNLPATFEIAYIRVYQKDVVNPSDNELKYIDDPNLYITKPEINGSTILKNNICYTFSVKNPVSGYHYYWEIDNAGNISGAWGTSISALIKPGYRTTVLSVKAIDPSTWKSSKRYIVLSDRLNTNFDVNKFVRNSSNKVNVSMTPHYSIGTHRWYLYKADEKGNIISSVIQSSTSKTPTFTNLTPYQLYVVKHGVYDSYHSWSETRKVIYPKAYTFFTCNINSNSIYNFNVNPFAQPWVDYNKNDYSHLWKLYESDAFGNESSFILKQTKTGTNPTFSGLTQGKYYTIKHGVWNSCFPWKEHRKVVYMSGGSPLFKSTNISKEDTENIKSKFNIYPNPTKDIVNIEYLGSNELIEFVKILNLMGQEVFVKYNPNSNKTQIDLSSFNKGLYIINVKTTKNNFIDKIVIE